MLLAPVLATLVVTVSTPADLSPTLVDRIVAEADAIWRPSGLTLIWNRGTQPAAGSTLRAVISHARGTTPRTSGDEPLGWITFEGGAPLPLLYVSYVNAVELLQNSPGVVGRADRMPLLERDTYLGRALGRALAHELGHYLFASKAHTRAGLMKATHTAWELFESARGRFQLTPDERATIDRLAAAEAVVAGSTSGWSSPTCQPPASMPPGRSLPSPPIRC